MNKIVLTGLVALTLAASAAPASAQGFSVGVGFGDGWYGNRGYYGQSVSVGFGAPTWGYDDWGYASYAAAPCTCGTRYRSVRVAPRYRSSTYAWGGYPDDYEYSYASYPYNDYYYGGSYASVGFGWSDDGVRGRRSWRDRDRFDRVSREDRVHISNRETRFNDREIRGGREDFRDRSGMSRASMGGESRTTVRGGGELRGGTTSEFRGGAKAEIRGTSGRGGGELRSGAGTEFRGGASGARRGDNR
jgi:hypothetical protein